MTHQHRCNFAATVQTLACALVLLCTLPRGALALGFTVNTLADSTSGNTSAGSLRDGLIAINASTNLVNTIAFQAGLNGTILLTAPLPLVLNDVVIDGTGATITIDGASTYRIFFVGVDAATASTLHSQFPVSPAGKGTPLAVTLKRLTLQHGMAQGGAGGGGGMGAGGALFVNGAANVTLVNVNFANNQAKGGAGGAGFSGGGGLGGSGNAGGGGGGLFGAGGVGGGGAFGAGGYGGGGYSGGGGAMNAGGSAGTVTLAGISGTGGAGAGAEAGGSNGGGGGGDAVASGGGGFAGGSGTGGGSGGAGGFGGGGGNGTLGGSGGFGGGGGVGQFGITNGGNGGFGGGGGGTNASGGGAGGSGGFGGGGGATNSMNAPGGNGGFGGGGGASVASTGGSAGFGGGAGNSQSGANTGGGGAGFGGALFVAGGGAVSIQGSASETGDSAVAGASGGTSASPGHAAGSGFFLQGAGTLTITPGNGETQSIAGAITDEVGSAIPDPPSGADIWGLTKSGTGTLILGGINGYAGNTTVADGILRVTGDITSSPSVANAAAATLTGDGSFMSLDSFGTLAPGTAANSTGVLHAFGTVLLQAGALTCIHADGVGNSSSIFVNSLANLAGVVRIDFSAGPAPGTQYVLVDAGAIGGVFSGFETNMPGLDGVLGYSATQVKFTVTANDVIFRANFDSPQVGDSPCIAAFAN